MPVDTTMDFTPQCDPKTQNHYYKTYSDGSHDRTCVCGNSVVLVHPADEPQQPKSKERTTNHETTKLRP